MHLQLSRRPRQVTRCNCSICWRYGALWAYTKRKLVRIEGGSAIDRYLRPGGSRTFCRCKHCGCVTHHERSRDPERVIGVNTRLLPRAAIAGLRVIHLDGAAGWKVLESPGWP